MTDNIKEFAGQLIDIMEDTIAEIHEDDTIIFIQGENDKIIRNSIYEQLDNPTCSKEQFLSTIIATMVTRCADNLTFTASELTNLHHKLKECTDNWSWFDTNQKLNLYNIFLDDAYIRDAQSIDTKRINDIDTIFNVPESHNDEWYDFLPKHYIGTILASDEKEAIEIAAEKHNIDWRTIYAESLILTERN